MCLKATESIWYLIQKMVYNGSAIILVGLKSSAKFITDSLFYVD